MFVTTALPAKELHDDHDMWCDWVANDNGGDTHAQIANLNQQDNQELIIAWPENNLLPPAIIIRLEMSRKKFL